jgi:hypothetical protein
MAHEGKMEVRDRAGKERQQPAMTAWHRSFVDESAEFDIRPSFQANRHKPAPGVDHNGGSTHSGAFCRRLALSDVCPQSGFGQALGGCYVSAGKTLEITLQ